MMKLSIFLFLFLSLFLFLTSSVTAIEGTTNLLTVIDHNSSIGGTALVKLEILSGTGRVFIDSYPLSQLDTQISTRYAKEIACDFLELDCSKLDFFYTIRSGSSIIGGPSAGGAIAALTVALLDGQKINDNIAMTGTINSGGSIGAVGGVQAKINAANNKGFKTIIIPKFSEKNLTNSDNVFRVSTLEQALYYFTGKNYSKNYSLIVNSDYKITMQKVANDICKITSDFFKKDLDKNTSEYNNSLKFYNLSVTSLKNNDYYSTASFCFSANIRLRYLYLKNKTTITPLFNQLKYELINFSSSLEKKQFNYLSELETYMIVKERIDETYDVIDKLNKTNISVRELAYAIERYNSAVSWSNFFSLKGKPIKLDEKYLKIACNNKLSEVDERLNFIKFFIPIYENKGINDAQNSMIIEDYISCLFKATKAKAEINAIIGSISINSNNSEEVILDKLSLARQAIAKQQLNGGFPILAFSYYNYANALIGEDNINALIFSEYALEFSDLSIYFPRNLKKATVPAVKNAFFENTFINIIMGFFMGLIASIITYLVLKQKPGKNLSEKVSSRKKR